MQQATTPPIRLPIRSRLDHAVPVARRPSIKRGAAWEVEESYRKAALFLSRIVANGSRSILFCSARRGEGTTTAVLSVAHQLQESYGLRPLVVELNRRSPALVKLFALNPQQTLDAALDGSKPAVECVQLTASGLSVIPAGSRRAAAPHPRLAPGLKRVLSEVEGLFDVVLLDAPPVLTHTEASIAGSIVPTLILVVESGRTSSEVLERVKRELASEAISIAGTVLIKQKRFIPRWIYWWLTR